MHAQACVFPLADCNCGFAPPEDLWFDDASYIAYQTADYGNTTEDKEREEFYRPYVEAERAGVKFQTECDSDCEVCQGNDSLCANRSRSSLPPREDS